MRRSTIPLVTCAALAASSTIAPAMPHDHEDEFVPPPPFRLDGLALGGPRAAPAAAAYTTGARLASTGDGALAIDADSGALLYTDGRGGPRAQLAIGTDAGLLAFDPVARVAYVADRRGDRIAVVSVGGTLRLARAWTTPAEPYGVALAPDRATLLVTAIADRAVVAYDVATGAERWRVPLDAEPRGIAIAPDGTRALVGHLATGAVDEVALDAPHAVTRVALAAPFAGAIARGAFATTFLGGELAVTAYQRDLPGADGDGGRYGGGELPPITSHLAFLRGGHQVTAQVGAQQVRALAWDGAHDALYLAGLGNDELVQVTHASQVDAAPGVSVSLRGKGPFPGVDRCGADGLAITVDGDVLVWCSFTRSIARLDPDTRRVTRGPSLVASALDDAAHTGMVIFHAADANVSAFGGLACASCHLDGRTDGVAWSIHGAALDTPILAGRVADTAPYKWDGTAPDLPTSLAQTITRLGGGGLARRHLAALAAYVEAMPPVRAPTRDPAAIARGRAVFDGAGCASCHDGPRFTDRATHAFAGTLARTDTPSLLGLAASAPYFHDGSAATLDAVLADRGRVHGMTDAAAPLSDTQRADLRTFLESL